MSTNTKTRSALRAALKQEDAALTERIPDAVAVPVTPVADKNPATGTAPTEAAANSDAAQVGKVNAATTTKGRAKAPAKPAAKGKTKATEKPSAKTSGTAGAPMAAVAESKAPPPGKAPRKAPSKAEAKSEPTGKIHATHEAEDADHRKKPKSEKVVRDSFSMPASEHAGIKSLRISLGKAGRLASKSEVLRAGLKALSERSVTDVLALLDGLPVADKGKRKKH